MLLLTIVKAEEGNSKYEDYHPSLIVHSWLEHPPFRNAARQW